MSLPPSLPRALEKRSFHAKSGELGILPSDAPAFLKACDKDGIRVLGWELWIVDHRWDFKKNKPVSSPGDWCGGIPNKGGMGVISGTGKKLPATDDIARKFSDYLRFNFTIDN
jgi:hypothetical protein